MIPKNKTAVCVFAHPDDESFGPGGSIAALAQHNDVYLICATDGNDPGKDDDLTDVRKKELQAAAAVLGILDIFYLGYEDGTLRNDIYHEVAKKIQQIVDHLQADILLTFELRGVSGHVDHMALSAMTSYVFEKSKYPTELWYYCESEAFLQNFPEYFVFTPPGYTRDAVDLVVDVSKTRSLQLAAMKAHVSQASDAALITQCMAGLPLEEYFLVRKKA